MGGPDPFARGPRGPGQLVTLTSCPALAMSLNQQPETRSPGHQQEEACSLSTPGRGLRACG